MTIRSGPFNLLTDVPGIKVGHAVDTDVRSGVTVILPDAPALAGVDVRGGGPGTRETELLRPTCAVDRIDAIVLSGGSAFGLDAASGVANYLASTGRGWPVVGGMRVPIVPSAILFDLANGGDKNWGEEPPYRRLGREAVIAAAHGAFPLGNVGAGYGAAAGRIKGGLGSASVIDDQTGLVVAALVAANPVGSVTRPGTGRFWAADLEQDGEFGGYRDETPPGDIDLDLPAEGRIGGHTSIGVVVTNLAIDKASAERIAIMAQDGYARAIRPVHTPMDGDTIFAMSTGRLKPTVPLPLAVARVGSLAADCVARAVARAVHAADSLGGLPSWRSLHAG